MDPNKKALLRKKRVRIQQNFITALCLACMIFTVGWSVYAAKLEISEAEAANASNSSAASDSSAAKKKKNGSSGSGKKNKADSSAADVSSEDESSPYGENSVTDTDDDLSDAVFIGDSRTVGLMNSTDKPQATFLCAVGLHIDTALTDASVTLDNGNLGTIPQALEQKQFGRVYINFGTNELGWPYIDVFKEHYTALVQRIKELQPNAVIYAEGILPLTASQDMKGESVNNENALRFSQAIKEVAAEQGIEYLDCSPAVADGNGMLPEEASTDGIHMTSEYCLKWQNYIIDNT